MMLGLGVGLGFEGWCFRRCGERLGSLDSCSKQLSNVPITFIFKIMNKKFFTQEVEGGEE
jgi:hypothetical protein